jgi:hypothetical protein
MGAWRMSRYLISNLLGLVGAIAGGVLGFYTFRWLLGQGFYGLIIPGAFLGLGCSLLARHPSLVRGVLCAVAAFGLSQFTDWYFTVTNDSLVDFIRNGKTLYPVTMLMSAVATVVAFWLGGDAGFPGLGVRRGSRPVSSEPRSREEV